LGLDDCHNSSSQLANNIKALVSPDAVNQVSITQYLGVKDWYSMHYLSVCDGFWAPDPSGAGLTSTKINITCTAQSSGYSFSVATRVQNDLKLSVQELANAVTAKASYDTSPWVSLWYVGVVIAAVETLLLPFSFKGTRRINMYSFVLSMVSLN
jgi:hypothetical protein